MRPSRVVAMKADDQRYADVGTDEMGRWFEASRSSLKLCHLQRKSGRSYEFNRVKSFLSSSFRCPYGQYGPILAMCDLNLLLPGHESSGSPFWLPVGLHQQHGELHGLCSGHLPVQKCGPGHYHGVPHWLCVCHTADSALHTHLYVPQGERGKQRRDASSTMMACGLNGHDG